MSGEDVIWITLESVRQDRTSMGGHKRDTTPNLQNLADSAFSFDNCFSHDIWTRSSSASILTGYTPSAHQTWSNDAKLPSEITTIPEAFTKQGYRTACISPNPQLSPSTGLDRGFDDFHYVVRSTMLEESGPYSLLKWVFQIFNHGGGLTLNGRRHCLGYLYNEIAKKHIKSAAKTDDSLFLYLHHGDSHHAYVPPKAWLHHFSEEVSMGQSQAADLAISMSENLHEYVSRDNPFTDEEWRSLQLMYDTIVAYVDHLTGQLVEYAQSKLEDPIIVITGDHGELFGEHGLLAHMLVTHSAVSNVPLLVAGIDDLPSFGLVQHADIMQILCEELEIDHPVPIGKDIRNEPREFAVTQRGGARAREKLQAISKHNDGFDVSRFHPTDLTSIRTNEWRYQVSEDSSELFHISDEEHDVKEDNGEVASELAQRLQEWVDEYGGPVGTAERAEFSDDMEDQLRELGYLQ